MSQLRLYNAPWMSTFWLETFLLKKEDIYLDFIYKTLCYYYQNGGSRFYPNGLTLAESVQVLRAHHREAEADQLQELIASTSTILFKTVPLTPNTK